MDSGDGARLLNMGQGFPVSPTITVEVLPEHLAEATQS